MYRALCALAKPPTEPQPRRPIPCVSRPARQSEAPRPLPDAAVWFAQLVEAHLEGALLRYSMRQRLLRQADRLGLHRFEANLIIATIQHRRRYLLDEPAEAVDPAGRSHTASSTRWLPAAAAAVLLQSAILTALWLLWPGG